MKILSSASFSQISFLIRGVNYKNIYALLYQNLSSSDASFFAKIEVRNNDALWYVDSDTLKYKKYRDASADEKGEIADCIEEKSARIEAKISDLKEIAAFVKSILTIPSEDHIYYAYDSENNLIVTMTQWGCKNVSEGTGVGLVGGLLNVPRSNKTDVNLFIKYTDESPAANEIFYFSFGDEHLVTGAPGNPIETDSEGHKSLGKLKKGVIFTIANQPDKSDCNRIVTVTEQSRYELIFPFYTSYSVLVVNQFDEPIVNEKIIANGQLFITNDEGRFEVSKIEYFPDTFIELSLASDTDKNARFALQKNAEENNFKFVLTANYEYNLHIKTLLESGEPVPNYKLQIEKEGVNAQYLTGENGELALKDLTPDTEVTVIDWINPENKQTVTIQRGNNYCNLIIELPKEKKVRIKLLDLEGKPMKGVALNVKTKAGMFTETTDLDGYIYLPASKFSDKEKIKVDFSIKK